MSGAGQAAAVGAAWAAPPAFPCRASTQRGVASLPFVHLTLWGDGWGGGTRNCAGPRGVCDVSQDTAHGLLLAQDPVNSKLPTTTIKIVHPSSLEMARAAQARSGGEKESDGNIVIVGAGIVGASTAYHLAQLGFGRRVTVVEWRGIACAASGGAIRLVLL